MEDQKAKALHEKWLDRATYDLETAEALQASRRHIYAVFMSQQAVEKCLKALLAYNGSDILPSHNLRRLASMAGLLEELSDEDLKQMDFLSHYYLNARYKEDLDDLRQRIDDATVDQCLLFAKEKIKWLSQKMRPSPQPESA